MPATPEAPSTTTIGQRRTSSRQSPRTLGQAIGVTTRKAKAHRQNDRAIGGTVPAIARPTTELPAQNTTARASRKGANPHRRPRGAKYDDIIGT